MPESRAMHCSVGPDESAPAADAGEAAVRSARPDGVRRVALVITALNPGGGERVVAHLARSLPQRGVQVQVVCLRCLGQLGEELAAEGTPVACLSSTRRRDVGAVFRLAKVLRRFSPEAINVHDRASLPFVRMANWLAGRRAVVYTAHGLLFNADREPRRRYRWALRGATAVTATSEEVARRHEAVLGWRGEVSVVPNGVPSVAPRPELRGQLRGELGIGPDDFVFLSVGNVRPEKGFEDLLAAARLLVDEGAGGRFTCLVAGRMRGGAYCRDMLERQKSAGLEGVVRFLGYRGDVEALYAAADAFVLSSRSEGLPMVVLEAMMASLPVVATRVGGVGGVVEPRAGLLVEPARPDRLAHAMSALLHDRDLCARLGHGARQCAVAKHSLDRMARRYVDVYDRAAAGGGA